MVSAVRQQRRGPGQHTLHPEGSGGVSPVDGRVADPCSPLHLISRYHSLPFLAGVEESIQICRGVQLAVAHERKHLCAVLGRPRHLIGLGYTDELHLAQGALVFGGVGLGSGDRIIEGGGVPNRHALLIRAEIGVPKDAPNSKPVVSHFLIVMIRSVDLACEPSNARAYRRKCHLEGHSRSTLTNVKRDEVQLLLESRGVRPAAFSLESAVADEA